jgi:DNA-binding response OmpR family regulator
LAAVRILVVEDEKKLSELVARALRQESYAVDVADDGTRGWELAEAYDYDLLILDLMLPGLPGEEQVSNVEAGADDYLTKPFAFAELVMRVKALLRRGPVVRSSVLRVADLEVDRLTQQVRRAGKRIELTPKEFALLEYLASSPGRVFSRTMIIEHVWDQSFEGLTNIVDVYVRHLRAKIDDPFPLKLIRTVRGVGYGLGEEPPP